MNDMISRAKAIEALSTITMYKGSIPFNTAVMRIEQLPSAQLGANLAEVGTDCISRQQAIGALRNYLIGKNVPCDGTLTARLIENEVINKLPSAQPKRGKWILHTYLPHHNYCSICEKDSSYNKRWNFCPNCGAKMEVTT